MVSVYERSVFINKNHAVCVPVKRQPKISSAFPDGFVEFFRETP